MKPNGKEEGGESAEVLRSPRFNKELDPDNAVNPLSYEERVRQGKKYFYPEGDPEGGLLDDEEEE